MNGGETIETFACFGGQATVIVQGVGPAGDAPTAVAVAKRRLLEWHDQFSRFEPGSELSSLNVDPRPTVPVSPVMARLIEAILDGARLSGGLVDATLVGEIERAGYDAHFGGDSLPLAEALRRAPTRAAAAPGAHPRWSEISIDRTAGTVTRPPGLRFDSGGIAKGLFGDILSGVLGLHGSFAIDSGGDIRLGGAAGTVRPVQVASPLDDSILHTFEVADGAAATSGIGRRSWLDRDGEPAHHLLDPSTGRPAFTGVIQATALAPTAVEAEVLAKTALLRGPQAAGATLVHGGLVVRDDGSIEIA